MTVTTIILIEYKEVEKLSLVNYEYLEPCLWFRFDLCYCGLVSVDTRTCLSVLRLFVEHCLGVVLVVMLHVELA